MQSQGCRGRAALAQGALSSRTEGSQRSRARDTEVLNLLPAAGAVTVRRRGIGRLRSRQEKRKEGRSEGALLRLGTLLSLTVARTLPSPGPAEGNLT